MNPKLQTAHLDCDGGCGSYIKISLAGKTRKADCMGTAEMLGWTTRDGQGKTTEVYCAFCQERAKRIVGGSHWPTA